MGRDCFALAHKILLVDDMRLNRLVLGRMLTKLGFEVVEADNGLAAIEQFIFHQPALSCVLLDLQMPVLDGWETAKRLRGLEAVSAWARVPIVACTALSPQEIWHSHDTVAGSALSSGCDDLLEKMPTVAQLLAMLTKYVTGLRSSLQSTPSPPGSPLQQQQQQQQQPDSAAYGSSSIRQQPAAVPSSVCNQQQQQHSAVQAPPRMQQSVLFDV
ncbi:hypothetical protein OEZ86_010962 [Tetradesmus obliquus]|nr:hypothetical protein OEZ86_010962 [Tetradesmus obliquus]